MNLSRKKVMICTAVLVILIALICLAVYLKSVADYKKAVYNITFESIDVSKIKDGTYTGDCDVNFVYAKVEVAVKDGKITDIEIIEHKNGRGKPAEAVVDEIIDAQSIDVDAISGATNSSLVLKKAVENALTKS